MIIVLHGPDTFRSRYKLRELENAYKEKHAGGFSFKKFYADSATFGEFKNMVRSQSLFDEYRFVVLEDVSENPALKKEIAEWEGLKEAAKDAKTLIIFYESNPISKDAQYEAILKLASKKQEFKKLSEVQQVRWFASNLYSTGQISTELIQTVVGVCRGDMWQAYNELNKLYSYVGGGAVKEEDLKTLSIAPQEAQIFGTIDAIFEGKTDRAFQNILLHWRGGEAPEYLFFMIERQLKLLALVNAEKNTNTNSLAKDLGLHPFVVQKTLRLSRKFSWPKIKDLYERVENLDIKSKTGRLDPYLSCELLAAAVLS